MLYKMGVRLIAFDRPGYGGSDRQPGRRVVDVAADVADLADALHLDRFAVLGRSGGGPHALACAALLPDRVTRVAVLVGLAETADDSIGEWSEQMTGFNRRAYHAARRGARAVMARLEAERFQRDPNLLVRELYAELTESDRRVIDDAGIRSLLISSWTEGIRQSTDGWIDDLLAFVAPWGFDQADIRVPTLVWHGADDHLSPVGHARNLGARIPGSHVVIQPGRGHFGALNIMPDIISGLAHGHRGWNSISPSIRRWALASATSG
ncbi:alpha/beta hydrolase [Actinocorallia longicatena]|uniref:Alpha/beta hydrolase n=1 Tax=Actinocorallia longicatena TaxID=111803 RepID=A0ABP6Q2R0_9ACTN